MQSIEEQVVFVLSQIIESICPETTSPDKKEDERNFILKIEKVPDEFPVNSSHNEISQKTVKLVSASSDIFSLHDNHNNEFYSAFSDTKVCSDNTREKFNPRTGEKVKDIHVQTIFYTPGRIDNQCQCDLLPAGVSTFTLPGEKKQGVLKSYSYISYGNTHWQYPISVFSQTGSETLDNKVSYRDHRKPNVVFKSTSRIRVGLSRRFKHSPLHNHVH